MCDAKKLQFCIPHMYPLGSLFFIVFVWLLLLFIFLIYFAELHDVLIAVNKIACFICYLQVDESLSFLDDLVSEALSNGASPYRSASERNIDTKNEGLYFA